MDATDLSTAVSSLKLQAEQTLGDEGRARETRRCLMVAWEDEDSEKGAVKGKGDEDEGGRAIGLSF